MRSVTCPHARLTVVGDRQHLPDLRERESGCLGVADELKTVYGFGFEVAVTRWCAIWIGEEPHRFPEANRGRWEYLSRGGVE